MSLESKLHELKQKVQGITQKRLASLMRKEGYLNLYSEAVYSNKITEIDDLRLKIIAETEIELDLLADIMRLTAQYALSGGNPDNLTKH